MKRLRPKHVIIGGFLFLLLFGAGGSFYSIKVEPRWLKIRTIALNDHPTLRIAHLSDFHFKGDTDWLEEVVKETNALNPDVICITGDFIESADRLAEVLKILKDLEAPVVAVKGNHEDWSGVDLKPLKRYCLSTGGRFLDDESFSFKGLDFYGASKPSKPPASENDRCVLLCHYPAIADALNGTSYDLILAGHTHGGQVRLPFVGALVIPYNSGTYEKGLYPIDGGHLHVSPGIGTLTPDVRFLCRPEVTLILF